MSGLLMPVQYGAPSTSYQDDESLCSSRQGLIRSQRSSTVSSTTPEERIALKRDAESTYQESPPFTTLRLSRKRLLIFTLVFISLLVLSSLFTAIIMHSLSSSTCKSLSCITAAETLRRKAAVSTAKNNSISPCDDFYEYTCAGWDETTRIRAARGSDWNVLLETSFNTHDKITSMFGRLMVNPLAMKDLTKYQLQALTTYATCMRESIEDATEALVQVYKEFGGWLSTAQDQTRIEESLLGAYRTNAVSLFNINAQIDAKDIRSHTVLTIEEAVPFIGSPSVYVMPAFNVRDLLNGHLDKHWVKTVLFAAGGELGQQLGMHETAEFREALAHAVLLDYKITRCSPSLDVDRSGPVVQWRTTVGELRAFEELFDFRYFLKIFIGRDVSARTEIVIGPGREYFMKLMTVLREYSTPEGQKVIRDYIKFKQLFLLSIHSGKLVQSKELGGLETLRILYTGDDDRSVQCINRVGMANQLGFASLLERYWAPQLQENMENARKIGEAMRLEYIDALRKSAVIDEVDRAAMIDKAERIRIRVAVPEAARDVDSLEEEYSMIPNGNDSTRPWAIFFTTIMGNRHWKRTADFGKPVNRNEWPVDTNPFNHNVHYNYETNSILFPIIWSLEQYLDSRLPSLFSFAGFGSIIGHEMTHAFDFKGRNFGPSGVDRNLTSGKTSKNFEAKQQCFLDQYTDLGEPRITEDVLAENLADNVAIRLAFKAWTAQDELSKKRLPGVDLTSEQAFFTAYAQNWCSVSKGASGTHSVGKLRMRWFLMLLLTIATIHSFPAFERVAVKRHGAFSPILRPSFQFSGSGSNAELLEQLYQPYGIQLDRIPSRPSSRLI